MQQLMTGTNEPFDPAFYDRLVKCLNKLLFLDSVEAMEDREVLEDSEGTEEVTEEVLAVSEEVTVLGDSENFDYKILYKYKNQFLL